ncbi:polyprenyl synthetase family protein [Halomicrobium sp. HM KBTZ05]|uniref:polyprenyl synthetase family protein n=1 Tax=Halomicrobium sp. HM KBTZ05 TaxID=3242663 RepID=UPI00355849B5
MSDKASSTRDVLEWLQRDVTPSVDNHLEAILGESQFADRLTYQIRSGGKRLRPGLAMLSGTLCGLEAADILDIAAAVEMIHTYSLLHDDLVDDDRYRRGEPAFWVEFGHDDAINIGDMMFTRGLKTVPDDQEHLAIETVHEMTAGQQMDLDFDRRRDVTSEEYLEMVQKKTGSLFDLCLELPQAVSDTDLDVDGYSSLWPAFQIYDDIQDCKHGKGKSKPGGDICSGKRTLMTIHTNSDEVYDILDKPPEETTQADVQEVIDRYQENGSITYARNYMEQLQDDAKASLQNLPESPERTKLQVLAQLDFEL